MKNAIEDTNKGHQMRRLDLSEVLALLAKERALLEEVQKDLENARSRQRAGEQLDTVHLAMAVTSTKSRIDDLEFQRKKLEDEDAYSRARSR